MAWRPSRWVSGVPTGLGYRKPHHFAEMMKIAWANKGELGFAWRILRDGVCDGCALGTSGLRDWTIEGTHLCMVRLELMRLNTMPALDPARLADVDALRELSSAELRELGRLPEPMVRERGDRGFRVISWDEAYERIARRLRATDPDRAAFYLTSRGIMNETYYAAQKAARFYGTNHVDNSARLCHAASTTAMKAALGHGAATCSYKDWLGADLIVFFGSNTPNNQPVTTKYLYEAQQRGCEFAVVNPFREPGLERYWIPSNTESAVFGTRLADHWFEVHTGGDLAFLIGVMRALIEAGGIDEAFVAAHTEGFEACKAQALATAWDALEAESGTTRGDMERLAKLLIDKPNAIFVWSMGLTQHERGVDTVAAVLNLGLARGLVGENRGMVPIRGHSGVQGGAEVGCVPAVSPALRERWQAEWAFPLPANQGMSANEQVEAAARGDVDLFWIVGGNFLETLGGDARNRASLERPAVRIHQDIVVTTMMLVDPAEEVVLLPATTRYESPGGGTETTTERRIIFSPEIEGRRIGSARAEWQVFSEVMQRVHPERAEQIRFDSSQQLRDEIGRAIPLYAGIEVLSEKGDQFQWGGRHLFADGTFATPDGKGHFAALAPKQQRLPDGKFYVSTRRGKQFNSMVQRETDPLTGAQREDILISSEDAYRLDITEGDRIRLVSADGSFLGRARLAPIRPGNLAVHWPEGNALLDPARIDPRSLEPDYNALVSIERG